MSASRRTVSRFPLSSFVVIVKAKTFDRDDVIESIRALKGQPGGTILTDGSSQLVHAMIEHDLVDELRLLVYPLTLGSGKKVLRNGIHATFTLVAASPDPTGVVGLHSARRR